MTREKGLAGGLGRFGTGGSFRYFQDNSIYLLDKLSRVHKALEAVNYRKLSWMSVKLLLDRKKLAKIIVTTSGVLARLWLVSSTFSPQPLV